MVHLTVVTEVYSDSSYVLARAIWAVRLIPGVVYKSDIASSLTRFRIEKGIPNQKSVGQRSELAIRNNVHPADDLQSHQRNGTRYTRKQERGTMYCSTDLAWYDRTKEA